ncbi:Ribonuclease P protein component [Candidatus Rubidus massiliensis]|nr:MAG: ribonuclease P protein component [Chlamydia sp. 32-24]CDZ80371.1 Ribonuclease P protein component [Candidatus Rubidus massiliensis]
MNNSCSFPKGARIKQRHQFKRLSSQAKYFVAKHIIIDYLQNSLPYCRLGITVTRRFGKAHERNAFKRKVRECFRKSLDCKNFNYDFNIKPKVSAKEATLTEICCDLDLFFKSRAKN